MHSDVVYGGHVCRRDEVESGSEGGEHEPEQHGAAGGGGGDALLLRAWWRALGRVAPFVVVLQFGPFMPFRSTFCNLAPLLGAWGKFCEFGTRDCEDLRARALASGCHSGTSLGALPSGDESCGCGGLGGDVSLARCQIGRSPSGIQGERMDVQSILTRWLLLLLLVRG